MADGRDPSADAFWEDFLKSPVNAGQRPSGFGGVFSNNRTEVSGGDVQFGHRQHIENHYGPNLLAALEKTISRRSSFPQQDLRGYSRIEDAFPKLRMEKLPPVGLFARGSPGARLCRHCNTDTVEAATAMLDAGQVNDIRGRWGTPLQSSIFRADAENASVLISYGANVNARNPVGVDAIFARDVPGASQLTTATVHTALEIAVLMRKLPLVKLLLDHGARANTGSSADNVLKAAVLIGDLDIARCLVQKGALVHDTGGAFGDSLQAAAYLGNTKIATMLLDSAGCNVNRVSDGPGFGTALQAAVCGDQAEMVKLLIKRGAKDTFDCGIFGSALQAASYLQRMEHIEPVSRAGPPPTTSTKGLNASPLHAAARNGHLELVRRFLDDEGSGRLRSERAQERASGSRTPLHEAVEGGWVQVVEYLLERGYAADAFDPTSRTTPITCSINSKQPQCFLQLLKRDSVCPRAEDLLAAIQQSEPDLVRYLLLKGAVAKRDHLELAIRSKDLPMTRVLIARGALNRITQDAGSLLAAAIQEAQDIRILKLLLQHDVDPNSPLAPLSALALAIKIGSSVDTVQLLLAYGARAAPSPFVEAQSPLQWAVARGDHASAVLLLQKGASEHADQESVLKLALARSPATLLALLQASPKARLQLKTLQIRIERPVAAGPRPPAKAGAGAGAGAAESATAGSVATETMILGPLEYAMRRGSAEALEVLFRGGGLQPPIGLMVEAFLRADMLASSGNGNGNGNGSGNSSSSGGQGTRAGVDAVTAWFLSPRNRPPNLNARWHSMTLLSIAVYNGRPVATRALLLSGARSPPEELILGTSLQVLAAMYGGSAACASLLLDHGGAALYEPALPPACAAWFRDKFPHRCTDPAVLARLPGPTQALVQGALAALNQAQLLLTTAQMELLRREGDGPGLGDLTAKVVQRELALQQSILGPITKWYQDMLRELSSRPFLNQAGVLPGRVLPNQVMPTFHFNYM